MQLTSYTTRMRILVQTRIFQELLLLLLNIITSTILCIFSTFSPIIRIFTLKVLVRSLTAAVTEG